MFIKKKKKRTLKIIISIVLAILTLDIYLEGTIRNVWKGVCMQRVFITALIITLKNWKQTNSKQSVSTFMRVHTATSFCAPAILSQTTLLWGFPVQRRMSSSTPDPWPLTPTHRQGHPPGVTTMNDSRDPQMSPDGKITPRWESVIHIHLPIYSD